MVVDNPGIVKAVKKNLKNRVRSYSVFRIDAVADKRRGIRATGRRLKILNLCNTTSCTNPVAAVFILRNLKNYVAGNSVSCSNVSENLFIFHQKDSTAIGSNPDNIMCIFINSHYIFSIQITGILFKRFYAAVFMNNT